MRLLLISPLVLIIFGCDQSTTGYEDMLSESELKEAIAKADKGDKDAYAKLAFHYGMIADRDRANFYFEKCLKAKQSDCLADEAEGLIARHREMVVADRPDDHTLEKARELNYMAFINVDPEDSKSIAGFQGQAREIQKEIDESSLTSIGGLDSKK